MVDQKLFKRHKTTPGFFKPFRTLVPFWGTNYLKFDWFVPETGLRF